MPTRTGGTTGKNRACSESWWEEDRGGSHTGVRIVKSRGRVERHGRSCRARVGGHGCTSWGRDAVTEDLNGSQVATVIGIGVAHQVLGIKHLPGAILLVATAGPRHESNQGKLQT